MKTSYDAIGVAATPATLTALYADNSYSQVSKYLNNLHLDIKYTPKAEQTDRYAYILIEASNDGGTTYFPVATKLESTKSIALYDEDADGNVGIPLIIPGDKTSTGGVAYTAIFDANFIADKVRVSAKESGSGNFGTLYVRLTLSD